MLYLQFWLTTRGITENRFLYVNKLTKEKDGKNQEDCWTCAMAGGEDSGLVPKRDNDGY